MIDLFLSTYATLSAGSDSLSVYTNTSVIGVSEYPSVKPYVKPFDDYICSVFSSLGFGAPAALDLANGNLETVSISNVETYSVCSNFRVVWPFFKGAFIAACTTLVALYSPNIIDWIHPIQDGFYVLNLHYLEFMFTSSHNHQVPTYIWNFTLNWLNGLPNHIPYGFNIFNLFDGMPSGIPRYVIDYMSFSPDMWRPNTLIGQSNSDYLNNLLIFENWDIFGIRRPPRLPEELTILDRANFLNTSEVQFTPWKWVLGSFFSTCIIRFLFNLFFNL